MRMMRVESSMLKEMGYDPTTKVLVVQFNNDSIYSYQGVTPQLWDDLQAADSMGRFFNQHIRTTIPWEKVS